MSQTTLAYAPSSANRLRSLVELGKPRLSLLVIFTAGAGIGVMPGSLPLWATVVFLGSTSVLVAAANTLNCWIERDGDGLMQRTCSRPLPTGRIEPTTALVSGLALATAGVAGILVSTNALTAGLGLLAFVSYAWVYTPLKRVTPWAVFVGSLPGALPPLMGATAVSGGIDMRGLFVFGILFLWQLPHFIAISLYLREDFRRGGIRVLPLVHGVAVTRWTIFASSVALLAFSLLTFVLPFGGALYGTVATLAGAGFVLVSYPGGRRDGDGRWARRVFLYSLIYLPIVLAALVVDLL